MAKNNGEEKNEVAVFIEQAINKGLPVETMEKLFALRKKVKAEQAREAYVDALSIFQSKCPVIAKTKKVLNKYGRTVRYTYAPLDAIAQQIKKPLGAQGLSYSWEVENTPGLIKATAKVTHRLGHSETSSFEVPIDTEGYMTAPQKYASALTFAKRYSLCDILGIATSDEDTDAVDVGRRRAPSHRNQGLFSFSGLSEMTPKQKRAYRMPCISELDLI
jgi:ERF superfamily